MTCLACSCALSVPWSYLRQLCSCFATTLHRTFSGTLDYDGTQYSEQADTGQSGPLVGASPRTRHQPHRNPQKGDLSELVYVTWLMSWRCLKHAVWLTHLFPFPLHGRL